MSFSLDQWKGKVCVVTGGSSGIGAAIAEKLALTGLVVVAVARRKEKLEELSKLVNEKYGVLHLFVADVTKESEILNLFDWVKTNLGPVHVLVNASGVARLTTNLVDGDTKLWKEVLDTNVLGLCIATREAIKHMRENNIDGQIIHINSILGHYVPDFPNINLYSASKHAVTALTETLRKELITLKSNIKISSISPGLVHTEMYTAAANGNPEVLKLVDNLMTGYPSLKATDVSDAVLYILSTPPHVQVHDIIIRPLGEIF